MNEQLIKDLIQSELKKVDAKWPNYHSHHEAYAVIKEEVEELRDAYNHLKTNNLDYLWDGIKANDESSIKCEYNNIKTQSFNCIKEAVQVYVTALRAERLIKQ